MLLFATCAVSTLRSSGLERFLPAVLVVLVTQLATHGYQAWRDEELCNPRRGPALCNLAALCFGLFFLHVFLQCEWSACSAVAVLVSLYMVVSHVVTVLPGRGTVVIGDVETKLLRSRSLALVGSYLLHEPRLRKRLFAMQQLVAPRTVVDAGAYVGDTALFLARDAPAGQRIYAVEPCEQHVRFMDEVKRLNGLDNFTAVRALLGGPKPGHFKAAREGAANASYENASEGEEAATITSVSLDALQAEGRIEADVGLLHVDVEGMELDVLRGARELLRTQRPYVVVDTFDRPAVDELLAEFGYAPETIHESCNLADVYDVTRCRNYVYAPPPRMP